MSEKKPFSMKIKPVMNILLAFAIMLTAALYLLGFQGKADPGLYQTLIKVDGALVIAFILAFITWGWALATE